MRFLFGRSATASIRQVIETMTPSTTYSDRLFPPPPSALPRAHSVGLKAFVVFLKFGFRPAVRYRLPRQRRIESPSFSLVHGLLFGGPLRLDHVVFALVGRPVNCETPRAPWSGAAGAGCAPRRCGRIVHLIDCLRREFFRAGRTSPRRLRRSEASRLAQVDQAADTFCARGWVRLFRSPFRVTDGIGLQPDDCLHALAGRRWPAAFLC